MQPRFWSEQTAAYSYSTSCKCCGGAVNESTNEPKENQSDWFISSLSRSWTSSLLVLSSRSLSMTPVPALDRIVAS